jgi:hypothetical protein
MIFNSRSTQRSWRRFGRWESYERRAPPKHRGSSRGGLVSRMRGIIIHGGWPAQRLQIKVKIRTKSLSSCRRKAVKTPTGGQERRVDLAATSHPAVVVPPFTASLALSLSLSLLLFQGQKRRRTRSNSRRSPGWFLLVFESDSTLLERQQQSSHQPPSFSLSIPTQLLRLSCLSSSCWIDRTNQSAKHTKKSTTPRSSVFRFERTRYRKSAWFVAKKEG